jgi:diguanylate cyclase (GGDEF)-like protein/PAS domain S-box-containing protein
MFRNHALLQRQLKKLRIDPSMPPSDDGQWEHFLERIGRAYTESDQERYLMERSQDIASRELQELYGRLEEAQQVAGLGNWSYSAVPGSWRWSEECLRICDLDASSHAPRYRKFWRMVLRRDATRLREAIAGALRHAQDIDIAFRLHLTGRGIRWVRIIGKAIPGKNGALSRIYGTAIDITSQKRVEARQAIEHLVTRMLATSESPEVLIPKLLQTVCEHVGWSCGAYWARTQQRDACERTATWSVANTDIKSFCSASADRIYLHHGSDLLERVIMSGTPAWIADLAQDGNFRRAVSATRMGLKAAFAFPIQAGQEVRGVMEFHSRRIQEADPEMLQSAHFIGRHIGQYLERCDAESALRESEAHFRALVEQATDSFYVHDADGRLLDVNQHACRSLGYAREELLGMSLMDIDIDLSLDDLQDMKLKIASGTTVEIETTHRRKNGVPFPVEMRVGQIHIGGSQRMLSLARDVTERRRLQEHIHHLAYHDSLTDLPNRAMFNRCLRDAIARAERQDKRMSVLFVDLDRFKNVNDTLGHGAGDLLLQEMSRRIASCLRTRNILARADATEDIVARLGGDEFVVLLEGVRDSAQAAEVAQRVLDALVREYVLDDQLIHMTASIGLSMYPEDGRNDFTLMKHADIAMYRAKDGGKNRYEFYSPCMNGQSARTLALESGLRRAIERGELTLYYQAKVDARSGGIAGIEALVRWEHPELGLVSPLQFIPLAEETGLIVPLSRWVLKEACRQHAQWIGSGLPRMRMAINLSARQFVEGALDTEVLETLAQFSLDARLLELEITESMLMSNTERTINMLARLREQGIRIAIDDFGVGYSSLSQLKQLPFDVIKIDQSFIKDIPTDTSDAAITDAIIAMGKRLEVTVVAEGVETMQQWQFLREHGCDEVQGYLFSKPLPADEFNNYVISSVSKTMHVRIA